MVTAPHEPYARQYQAITAPLGPILVLAGPGAGKTFCLIERIAHLLATGADPARICAVTFTNKAAEEIAVRLHHAVGHAAEEVTRGTLHSLCLNLLREHGERIGLPPGFGVADEAYQLTLLARLRVPVRARRWHLTQFGRHRLEGLPLDPDVAQRFAGYLRGLRQRSLVDFDDIILLANRLLSEQVTLADRIADRWDHILVDEFQDLDPVQFAIVARLAKRHNSLFAVGDDEQSIFGWRGADPDVFRRLRNEFAIAQPVVLDQNRRCSTAIFQAARRLIGHNSTLFSKELTAVRESPHPVEVVAFADHDAEAEWLAADLAADQSLTGAPWGSWGVLYRRHEVGQRLESRLVKAGIPCRLARGRALQDDSIIQYVTGSLRLVLQPDDDVAAQTMAEATLPRAMMDHIQTRYLPEFGEFRQSLREFARRTPRDDPDRRKAWRFLYHLENLEGLGRRHDSLDSLIAELLSQSVGPIRNPLEERWEELSSPARFPGARELAEAISQATAEGGVIWILPESACAVAIRRMLLAAPVKAAVRFMTEGVQPAPADRVIDPRPSGTVLRTFKALQLLAEVPDASPPEEFVTFDLETTGRDTANCGIIEVAAARVRHGEVVETFQSMVSSDVPISAQATEVHGYTASDLAGAPTFEAIWPAFRAFLGNHILMAHNGHLFDVPVLRRHAAGLPGADSLVVLDSYPLAQSLFAASAALESLAERFGIDKGTAHHAADDAATLARVVLALHRAKADRARRSSLVNLLGWLGLGLALESKDPPDDETNLLRIIARVHTLGRFGEVLEEYQAERAASGQSWPSVEDVIERLGGWQFYQAIRRDRAPEERYPDAVSRLGQLTSDTGGMSLEEAIMTLLERVALSVSSGIEVDPARVTLLTMHSTKGLEFDRVYLVGVEDGELPGEPALRKGSSGEVAEARRLLYVGMTRARDRLVMTRADQRGQRRGGGSRFLEEMGLRPRRPEVEPASAQ